MSKPRTADRDYHRVIEAVYLLLAYSFQLTDGEIHDVSQQVALKVIARDKKLRKLKRMKSEVRGR